MSDVCRHFLEGKCNYGDACNFKHPVADDRPNGHGMTGKAFRPRCDKSELLLKEQTHLGRRRLQAGVPPFPGGQVYLWRPVPVSARRRAQGRRGAGLRLEVGAAEMC
ncbi:unnamed protein product [Effrenium voratum]|nr:unnamed protein product [Effrenium voratum]